MALLRSRYLWIVVALLLCWPGTAAAGCHTDCSLRDPFGPCLNCGYRVFSDVMCYRSSCDACDTIDCGVALPSRQDQWASGATGSESCLMAVAPASRVKIVKVQRLAARS